MQTPNDIREYIESIQQEAYYTGTLLSDQVETLIQHLLHTLPSEPIHGKKCPECQRKCYTACRVCPHCHYRMKPKLQRAIQIDQLPPPPEPVPMDKDDCTYCFQTVMSNEKHILQCGCIYHVHCLKELAQHPYPEQRRCPCPKGRFIPQTFH